MIGVPFGELNVEAGFRRVALNVGRVGGLALPPLDFIGQREDDGFGIGLGRAAGHQTATEDLDLAVGPGRPMAKA